MGAQCCKPPEPELPDTVPVALDLQSDNLWKRANEIRTWATKFTNGEMQNYLTVNQKFDLMAGMGADSTALANIMLEVQNKEALVRTAWNKRQWHEVKQLEYEFKLLFVKASDIHTKYVGPTAGASTMQHMQQQMPQAGMGMQPPQSMEGEQNHVMPGNTMVPGVGAPAGAPNGFQQGMQAPNQFGVPQANGGVPPQNFQQQQQVGMAPMGAPQNFQQQQPMGGPPVNNPPPQAVPQAAPLELEEGMKKAAKVLGMVGENPARTELRKKHIENRFDEMVAIIKNDRAAYEAAKQKREAAEAAAPPPAARPPAGGPPAGPPVGGPPRGPPHAPAGGPPRGPPSAGPAHHPLRQPPGPAPSGLAAALQAGRQGLNNAKHSSIEVPQTRDQSTSIFDKLGTTNLADIQGDSWMNGVQPDPSRRDSSIWDD